MKKNLLPIIMSAGICAALLAGCGSAREANEPPRTAGNIADTTADKGMETEEADHSDKEIDTELKDEIIISLPIEPSTGWDPVAGYAGRFDPILQSTLMKAFNGELSYDLATGYEASEDGKTWTVTIRDDAFFSNGDKLTAKDVAFTYKAVKDAGTSVDLSNMIDAKALDDETVQFTLEEPDFTFVYYMYKIGIVPEALYDENYGENPIGSGPYKMVQWDKGQQTIWEYNDLYYGEEPAIKRIIIVFMDEDAQFAAIQKGDVDLISTNQTLALQNVDGYRMVNCETIDNYGIIFPTVPDEGKTTDAGKKIGNNVTSDAAIRKALAIGLDRDKLITDVFNGYGKPSFSMQDNMPWFNEETALNASNSGIDKAINLLEEAGWKDIDGDGIREKDGLKAEFSLMYTATNGNRQALAMAVAEQAKEFGINIIPEGPSNDEIQNRFHCDPYVFGRGDHTPDEFYLMTSSKVIGTGWNNTGYYSNPVVDEYLRQARASKSPEECYEYYKLAQWDGETGASLIGDAPDVWLVRADHCLFVRDGLDIGTQSIHQHNATMQVVLSNILEWKWD